MLICVNIYVKTLVLVNVEQQTGHERLGFIEIKKKQQLF